MVEEVLTMADKGVGGLENAENGGRRGSGGLGPPILGWNNWGSATYLHQVFVITMFMQTADLPKACW